MIEVTLPWPSTDLSPNARVHWARKAKAVRSARAEAYLLAKQELREPATFQDPVVHLTFCPPDRRRRDWDNMLAGLKSHLDGLSDALGIDDSLFSLELARGEPCKGGAVRVRVQDRRLQ